MDRPSRSMLESSLEEEVASEDTLLSDIDSLLEEYAIRFPFFPLDPLLVFSCLPLSFPSPLPFPCDLPPAPPSRNSEAALLLGLEFSPKARDWCGTE